MKLPDIIDIELTARCNLACPFCFGPKDEGEKDLCSDFWIDLLSFLKEKGLKGIVVSGGEPTLYKDLVKVLSNAKKLGLSIVVSTHGRFSKKIYSIVSYCDWLAIPVDGFSKESLTKMRGDAWGIKECSKLIHEVKAINPNLKIKLGTVATSQNLNEIILLADYISNNDIINRIDTWKIYQYTPRRKFQHLKELLEINNEIFQNLELNIIANYNSLKEKIYFSYIDNHKSAYLFVYPNGDAAICDVGPDLGDIKLGNVLKDGYKIFSNLAELNLDNHRNNYYRTYS